MRNLVLPARPGIVGFERQSLPFHFCPLWAASTAKRDSHPGYRTMAVSLLATPATADT